MKNRYGTLLLVSLTLLILPGTLPVSAQDQTPAEQPADTAAPARITVQPDSTGKYDLTNLDAKTRMMVIDSLIIKKKYKTAKDQLLIWIESEPLNDSLHIKLANLYEFKKYFQEAADIYEKLVYRNRKNKKYIRKTVSLFTKMRYYTVAIKYCDRYLALAPKHIKMLEKKAELQILEKKHLKAVKTLEKILALETFRDDIRQKIAQQLFAAGKYGKAVGILQNLYNTKPDHPEYGRDLCQALYKNKQYQEAEKLIKEVLRYNNRDYDILEIYCNLLSEQQRYTEAINYYYRLLQGDPMDIKVKWRIAQIYAWKGDYYLALSLYDQIMRTVNVPPKILRERARVLGWANQEKAALNQYEKILDKNPKDTLTKLEYSAKKSLYNQRFGSAINQHQKLVEKDKENWDARIQLAQMYSGFHRWNQGEKEYRKIIKVMPTFERVKVALNKLNVVSRGIETEPVFDYSFARSGDEYNNYGALKLDYEVFSAGAKAAPPPLGDLYLNAGYTLDRYHYDLASDRNLNRINIGVGYSQQPAYQVAGHYSFVGTPEGQDAVNEFGARLQYRVMDLSLLEVAYGTEAFFPNLACFTDNLQRQTIGVDYTLLFSKRLNSGIGYRNYGYSDSLENSQNVINAYIKYGNFFKRASIAFRYGVSYTDSKYDSGEEPALTYFSPDGYAETYFKIEWHEYLKGMEYYWGQDKIHYNLNYTLNLDGDAVLTHTADGTIRADLNAKTNITAGGTLEKSTRHSARAAYIKGLLYF